MMFFDNILWAYATTTKITFTFFIKNYNFDLYYNGLRLRNCV